MGRGENFSAAYLFGIQDESFDIEVHLIVCKRRDVLLRKGDSS